MSDHNGLDGGFVRAPWGQVVIGGAAIQVLDLEVTSCGHYAADSFSATLALNANPSLGLDFWAGQNQLIADLQIGFQPLTDIANATNGLSLVQGEVDTVDADPVRGIVRIEGRDLSSRLIESRTSEAFANQTSSEIAQLLAARRGFSANIAATPTPVGRFYGVEYDRSTLDQFSRASTEWDLLAWLAEQEGFDLWVSANTLNFQPPPNDASPVLTLRPKATSNGPCNVVSLNLQRSLVLAREISVTVKSWNSRQQAAYIQTASSSREGTSGSPQTYALVRPNITPATALAFAQMRLAEICSHERVIEVSMPGELSLTARDAIAIEGTSSAFDQTYQVSELTRRLDPVRGFVQTIRARAVDASATLNAAGEPED